MFEIPLSYQEATAAIIGNCIGANNVPLAIRFYKLSSWITAITVVLLQLVILFGRNAIATYFLASKEAQQMAESVLVVIGVMFFFDGMQTYMQGPIRAIDLQDRASWITFLVYYLIGLPLASYLALWTSLGIVGLQLGICVAIVLQFLTYAIILKQSDWHQIALKAQQRMKEEEIELQK